MNTSSSKRNGPTPSKAYKRNLRKRLVRYAKKAELRNSTNAAVNKESTSTHDTSTSYHNTSNDNQDNQDNERIEIFYDPNKHKTQIETRKSTKEETHNYILSQWISEDFNAEDLKSTSISQPITLISPKSTFVEKFIEKRYQRWIIKNPNLDDSGNSLAFNRFTPIPPRYLELLESEIFCETDSLDSMTPELWEKFGEWAGFEKVPNFRKKFRHHCHHLWTKMKHAYKLQVEIQKKPLELYDISEVFLRHPDDKLFIADETTKKVAGGINLDGYKYIYQSQCFKNAVGETMIDFFDLNVSLATKTAQVNLIEHFGCFTDSNNEPYVTTSTASSHCQEHQKCVRDLIRGLQPLSNTINNYINITYPALYTKMKKLDLGPNVPKSFGVFPTVGINFNSICQFHRDLKDHRNSLCVVCPLGTFEGEHLAFPELKLAFRVKQGQAITFRSHLLIHGNFPIISGSRHSVVFYIHGMVIKQNQKFGSLFDDMDLDASEILGSTYKEHTKLPKYSPPSLGSRKSITKLRNHRRSYLDLEPAKRELPAQYKKS